MRICKHAAKLIRLSFIVNLINSMIDAMMRRMLIIVLFRNAGSRSMTNNSYYVHDCCQRNENKSEQYSIIPYHENMLLCLE